MSEVHAVKLTNKPKSPIAPTPVDEGMAILMNYHRDQKTAEGQDEVMAVVDNFRSFMDDTAKKVSETCEQYNELLEHHSTVNDECAETDILAKCAEQILELDEEAQVRVANYLFTRFTHAFK